jgi:hypothetical protein
MSRPYTLLPKWGVAPFFNISSRLSTKCFQKAFELDAREADAARQLAEGFLEEWEWDLIEVVMNRTINIEGKDGFEDSHYCWSLAYLSCRLHPLFMNSHSLDSP